MKSIDTIIGQKLNKSMMNGMTSESKRVLGEITKDPAVHSAVSDYGGSVSTTSYWFGVGVTVAGAALAAGTIYVIDRAQAAWRKHKIKKATKELRESLERIHDNHKEKEEVNE